METYVIKRVVDLPSPGDGGFGETICVARQHGGGADVGRGVDLRLADTDGRKHWEERRLLFQTFIMGKITFKLLFTQGKMVK